MLITPILLYSTIFFNLACASIPQRVSANTLVLSRQANTQQVNEENDQILYAVNAAFGPSVWIDGSFDSLSVFTSDNSFCSMDNLPSRDELPNRPFAVVIRRSGCSYERKARNAERVNASALILINREFEDGLLFAPLPELSYYTAPPSEYISIPVMLTTKTYASMIRRKVSQDGEAFVSIYCAKQSNRALIHAWNLYWIWWLTTFTIILFCSIISLIIMLREPKVNIVIKSCTLLTILNSCTNIADMLTDHWNIRGIISEVGFQLMYWLEIDSLLYMFILTQWLWYRILDEKDLLKYKAIVINKPTIYAITGGTIAAGIMKIILIGSGVTVVTSWRIYDCILITLLSGLGICMSITGFRLRKRLNQMMNRTIGTFKLTLMMIVGNLGMQLTAISLLLWLTVPNLFGFWSWFVFNFYWRFATAFFATIFLIVYGTKFADRTVGSSSPRASEVKTRVKSSISASSSDSKGEPHITV